MPLKLLFLLLILTTTVSFSQNVVKGKIVDAATKEPLTRASLHCTDSHHPGEPNEIWVNALNALDHYPGNILNKIAFGYSYTLAKPRNINVGLSYNFTNLFQHTAI